MLYTFEDLETGDVRSAVAVNEAAARFDLGGIWTDVERTTAFEPCEIDGLPAIYREAKVDAEAARRAMVGAKAGPSPHATRWRSSQRPRRSIASARRGARS